MSTNDVNNITKTQIFDFMELFFMREKIIYRHNFDSFDKMIEEDIPYYLLNGRHVIFEKILKDKVYTYLFKFEKVEIREPMHENDIEPMFPADARNNNSTYSGSYLCKVIQVQEILDVITNKLVINQVGESDDNVRIRIPFMVGSKYCSLNIHKNVDNRECDFDPLGHFIVKGSEKVVLPQVRIVDNKALVFM
jgi:DNA-directed RNA polymerase II subunit RPB2